MVEVGPWTLDGWRVWKWGLRTSRQVQSDEVTTRMQDRISRELNLARRLARGRPDVLGDKEKGPEVGVYRLAASTAAILWTV